MKRITSLSLLAVVALISACSPNVETRGHVMDADWKEHIQVGATTKDAVLAQLGSPSTVSTFGEETWYYITMQRSNRAFFKPHISEEQVVRVVFDTSGMVSAIDTFDQNDMKNFAIAKRETPTEGHQMTVVEQTLGNLGRFNSPNSGARSNPGTVRREP